MIGYLLFYDSLQICESARRRPSSIVEEFLDVVALTANGHEIEGPHAVVYRFVIGWMVLFFKIRWGLDGTIAIRFVDVNAHVLFCGQAWPLNGAMVDSPEFGHGEGEEDHHLPEELMLSRCM